MMIASSIQDYQQAYAFLTLKTLTGQAPDIIQRQPDKGRYANEGDAAFLQSSRPLTGPRENRQIKAVLKVRMDFLN